MGSSILVPVAIRGLSVVVDDLDIVGIASLPDEADHRMMHVVIDQGVRAGRAALLGAL
jgi:hypothetical protein